MLWCGDDIYIIMMSRGGTLFGGCTPDHLTSALGGITGPTRKI